MPLKPLWLRHRLRGLQCRYVAIKRQGFPGTEDSAHNLVEQFIIFSHIIFCEGVLLKKSQITSLIHETQIEVLTVQVALPEPSMPVTSSLLLS
jgi:hypothetical protein